jgi:hypothetical protein
MDTQPRQVFAEKNEKRRKEWFRRAVIARAAMAARGFPSPASQGRPWGFE